MPQLKVIHKPAGYEAWKDEKTIPSPNYRAIFAILAVCFGAGCLCMATLGGVYVSVTGSDEDTIPTLVVIQSTDTPVFNVLVIDQVNATATPTFTPDPRENDPTPDMQATLDWYIEQSNALAAAQPTPVPKDSIEVVAVDLPPPVFCDGAPFERHETGVAMQVTFEEKSALRVLDRPRVPGQREPEILKQLYDGDAVIITGEPVCGEWLQQPVVYYPVDVPRWELSGFVGFGRNSDVWLEVAG